MKQTCSFELSKVHYLSEQNLSSGMVWVGMNEKAKIENQLQTFQRK